MRPKTNDSRKGWAVICCPLAWWYVLWKDMRSYRAAEAERIQHPVLRTLQETFILSETFKAMCFPCQTTGEMFPGPLECTLLQVMCLYIRWPWTTHNCVPKKQLRLRPTIPARAGQSPQHEGAKDTKAELSTRRRKRGCSPCEGELCQSDPKDA